MKYFDDPPFDPATFRRFCRRFHFDGRKFIEKNTKLPVLVSDASAMFRRQVEKMIGDAYWKRYWKYLTVKQLAKEVMWACGYWMVDAEVYAEYWLKNVLIEG
ncbi:hypothetical protein PQX77_001823 [Marasmius sp. AFHP31]|nr:hypothetical protein PQX77_001823 [Marasmius sp. AFHP31]